MTRMVTRKDIEVDSRGFLVIDGIKLCRVVGGRLELKDKDGRRSRERGSAYVLVSMEDLAHVVAGSE